MIDGLFDIENIFNKLSKYVDPLFHSFEIVPWKYFYYSLEILSEKQRKAMLEINCLILF